MDKYIQDLTTFGNWGITLYALVVLVISFILCGAIGIEREKHGYSAGLRTHILVGLGACLFTIVSKFAFPGGDPGRVAAQVVTGIGFIGAGTIIQNGINIKGLTTAATLWISAAIGMCSGSGLVSVAVLTTIISLVVLIILKTIEDRHMGKKTMRLVYLVPKGTLTLSKATSTLDSLDVVIKDIDIGSAFQDGVSCTKVVITIKSKEKINSVEVLDKLNSALNPLSLEVLH